MNYKDFAENVMKGTTTVGVICNDGVVMGADTRATMDTFIASSEAIKVNRIDDNLGLTIAGGVGDAEYITKLLKAQNELYKMSEGRPLSPKSATSLLSLILQENKYMPYIVQLIVGGINREGPEIYNLDPFGGYTKESKFTATGSGSPVALGYLEEIYNKSMSTQEMVKHAVKALRIAMKRDSATGDHVNVIAITKSGYKEYSQEEIEKITKAL